MKRWFEERHAPDPGTYLCTTGEIADKQVREFRFGQDTNFPFRMFIFNEGGTFRAYKNACPHFDVPLNHVPGDLFTEDGRYFLCMTHYAKFDTADGTCIEGPCEGDALDRIPLIQEEDRLVVGKDARAV